MKAFGCCKDITPDFQVVPGKIDTGKGFGGLMKI
jgi:hypothetical protein